MTEIKNNAEIMAYLGIASILIYTLFLLLFGNFIENNGVDIISLGITVVATVLSITISLLIVSFNFISNKVSSNLLPFLMRYRSTKIMLSLYLFTLIFNIIAINFVQFFILSYLSSALLIACLFYLIYFLFFIIDNLNEEKFIDFLGQNVSKSQNEYRILKELALRYIENNDLKKFSKAIDIFQADMLKSISKIMKKKIDEDYTYQVRCNEGNEVVSFYLSIYKQLFYEMVDKNRQFFLGLYIEKMEEFQKKAHPTFSIHSYQDLIKHFSQIGNIIIKKEYEDLYLYYWHSLKRIVLHEYDNLDLDMLEAFFDLSFSKYNELEKEEYIYNSIMRERFLYDRLEFLLKITKRAILKDVDNDAWFPSSILTNELLFKVISIKNMQKPKIHLLNRILYLAEKIQNVYLENKVYHRFLFLGPHSYIEKEDDEIAKEHISHTYVRNQLKMLDVDPNITLCELAIAGRFLGHSRGLEKSFKLIIDGFDYICEEKFKKKKLENLNKDYIFSEINSLYGKIAQNNKLVDKLIKKYNIKQSEYQYIAGSPYKKRDKKHKAN